MKKMMLLGFIVGLLNVSFAQDNSSSEASQFFKEIAAKYSPDAADILMDANLPSERFVTQQNRENWITRFSTIIHEDYHVLNHEKNGGCDANGKTSRVFWITKNDLLEVPKFPVFNAQLLNNFVDEEMKVRIPRYETYFIEHYVHEHDARINGIFGILEELCAYYQGSKAYVDGLDYLAANNDDAEKWVDYVARGTEIYALYEFKLFLSFYLQLAKRDNIEVYNSIVNSVELKVLYNLVEEKYSKLIDSYFIKRANALANYEAQGKVRLQHNYLWLAASARNGSNLGYEIPDNMMNFLKLTLEQDEHQILNELKLEGFTAIEYRQYLKDAKHLVLTR